MEKGRHGLQEGVRDELVEGCPPGGGSGFKIPGGVGGGWGGWGGVVVV